METEIKILMEQQTKILARQDTFATQLDADRADINNLRIDQSTIKTQQQVIIDNMRTLKDEIKQQVTDTLKLELPKIARKALKDEIRLVLQKNPKKAIERKVGIIESITNLFKK